MSAFDFFGGIPQSILYDNTSIAVAKILGDGKRERTRAFSELVSHYLFSDRFGRPGKGNDKGKVEGLVKYARRNFMTPKPQAVSYDALNAHLLERCRARQSEHAGRHTQTIGERLLADLAALRPLPPVPLEPCEKRGARVSSTALVRYRSNDYSVPTRFGFQDVMVKGFVDEVVILSCHCDDYQRCLYYALAGRGVVQMLDDLEWLFELFGPRCQMSGHILRSGQHPAPMVNPYVSSEPDGPVPARNADFTEGPSWYLDPGLGGMIEE